ncbi:MAG: ABC transporter substrate-binding protein [Chloroflexi bacterium]|nr:ABC transporter substrate-binding protein [Chloroflexota bacterium]
MQRKIMASAGHFHFFHRTAAIMAERRGYFKEEGLGDVEIKAAGEDELSIEGLKSGKIDFVLDVRPLVVISENNRGSDVYIVGGMISNVPTSLHGARGIRSVADLKGKRVGLVESGGGREALWVKDLLRRHGFDLNKDVTFVTQVGHTGLQNQRPRLDRGDHQAVLIAAPNSDQAVKEGYLRLARRSDEFPDYPDRVVATTGAMIAQHPGTVKGFLKGLIRGYRFVKQERNWPEIVKMVNDYHWERDMGWENFDRSRLNTPYSLIEYIPYDGSVTRKSLEVVITQARGLGLLPEGVRVEQATKFEFVEQAAKELNEKFGPRGYE